jgi:hypothetical protein
MRPLPASSVSRSGHRGAQWKVEGGFAARALQVTPAKNLPLRASSKVRSLGETPMAWLLVTIIVWPLIAVLVACVIGRAVHGADVEEGLATNPGGATAQVGKDDRDLPLHPPTPHDSSTIPSLPVARPPVTGRTRPRREPGDGSTSRPSG